MLPTFCPDSVPVVYRDPDTHRVENSGDTTIRIVLAELKGPVPATATP